MATISIETLVSKYPGFSEKEAARKMAEEDNYAGVIKYMSIGSRKFDKIGLCFSLGEIDSYIDSPNCHDVTVLYANYQ